MLATIHSSAITGIDAQPVDVEVRVSSGKRQFTIIGLGDTAIRESRERVFSALRACGFRLPLQVLVSLAPADIRKEGTSFDLAIAMGILIASGQLPAVDLSKWRFHGELSLEGMIRPVRGAVSLAICSLSQEATHLVLPYHNYCEANLVGFPNIIAPLSLADLVRHIMGDRQIENPKFSEHRALAPTVRSIHDVLGQEEAKRALVIAAAGGHNVLMIGPPGCGKSMLAERFPTLLPPLNRTELLDVVKIHSLAGMPLERLLSGEPPYRSPHHLISDAGLAGGGSTPRPGEITLAHHGVLFLDEFPEFRRTAIEALRSPLESGEVRIARARGSWTFPARFQLLAAMNPCPCGKLGSKTMRCLCSRPLIYSYLRKLSQPILDRIDLHVDLDMVPPESLTAEQTNSIATLEDLAASVACARDIQTRRNRGTLNAHLPSERLIPSLKVSAQAKQLLNKVAEKQGLSARGVTRVLKVARTIADLAACEATSEQHLAEALSFRSLDRIERFCLAA